MSFNMNIHIFKNKKLILGYFNEPLVKNSIYLMLTSISNSGFGFIFWTAAAKYYPKEDVGISTALISVMSLIVLLSRFGLDFSIVRFFPNNDKGKIFNTTAICTTFFSVVIGSLYIIGVDVFSPQLHMLKSGENALVFLIILAASSLVSITGISFVAIRRSGYYLLQSLLTGSRVIYLIPLIAMGSMGILSSVGASVIFALLFSYASLYHLDIMPGFQIDKNFLTNSLKFSIGNYVSGLSMAAPAFVLPIMVFNVLGSEQSAYYYIVYSITSFLFMIPNTISMSLFVEGSNSENFKKSVYKSLSVTFAFLIPPSILMYNYGNIILGHINEDYATAGVDLLKIMIISSFFVSFNFIYFSIKRIQKDVYGLVIISGANFVLLILLSYLFMDYFGLIGIGYAWVISYLVGSIFIFIMAKRENWI